MKHWLICANDPNGNGSSLIALSWNKIPKKIKNKVTIIGDRKSLKVAFKKACVFFPEEQFIETSNVGKTSDVEAAKATAAALEKTVGIVKSGEAIAVITAPLNKERMNYIWPGFQGQTEWLGKQLGGTPTMMFCSPKKGAKRFPLVLLATTHVSLKNIHKVLKKETITSSIEAAHNHLIAQGIKKPKIAVLGLNPHAGDGGILGREEEDIIKPAIVSMKAKGMNIHGPFSADSFFMGEHEAFDAVIPMYHDQGLIAAKFALGFDAVNVTLGLPIIRTSPGQGTAEGISFTKLNPRGMVAAIKVAEELSSRFQGF